MFGEPDEFYGLASPDEVNGHRAPALDLWREELASVSVADKVALVLELERATKAADARVRNVEAASYGDARSEAALVNSLGVEAYTRHTMCSASSVAIADDGTGVQTGYGFDAAHDGRRPRSRVDPTRVAGDARMPDARRGADQGPPAAGDPRSARHAISMLGVLSSAFNGESMLKGRSLFTGRAGELVVAPIVQLLDDPTDERALGASPYDGDGVPTRRNALIVDGVLHGSLHNVYTGRRSGVGTTASATRWATARRPASAFA